MTPANAPAVLTALEDSGSVSVKGVSGKLGNLKVTPLSFYIFVAGGTLGVIAAIAGVILGQSVVTFSGVSVALLSTLGALKVKEFITLKNLDEIVDKISTSVSTLAKQVFGIKKENQNLADVVLRLQNAVLSVSYQKSQAELAKKIQELHEVTQSVEKTMEALRESQGVNAELRKLVDIFSSQVAQISSQADKWPQWQKEFSEIFDHLDNVQGEQKEQQEVFGLIQEKLNHSLLQFQDLIKQHVEDATQIKEANLRLEENLQKYKDLFLNINEQNAKMAQFLDILKKIKNH